MAAREAVYLDHAASSVPAPGVAAAMADWLGRGNPAAPHCGGRAARRLLARLRAAVLAECGAAPEDFAVVLTSGATEANATALTSAARAWRRRALARLGGAAKRAGPARPFDVEPPQIVAGASEHKSVRACLDSLEADGLAAPTLVAPSRDAATFGETLAADIAAAIRDDCALVSCMAANNETGAINDVPAVAAACRARGVPLHVDATQLFGKVRIAAADFDALSVSFHKLGGPPGVGALVMRRSLGWRALIPGAQNEGLRGGTENAPAAAGALAALDALGPPAARARAWGRVAALLDAPWPAGVAPLPVAHRLPNIVCLALPGRTPADARAARDALEAAGVVVGLGSACAYGEPSIAELLGVADGVLRVSAGPDTSAADVDALRRALPGALAGARAPPRRGLP